MMTATTMSIFEIEEYAKDHGFDSLEFLMFGKNGVIVNGRFLDAYYGMVQIPELGDGFVTLDNLRKEAGNDFFTFLPLDTSEEI